MSKTITIFIPGEPVAQKRPRVSVLNGHAHVYDHKDSVDYKQLVSLAASKEVSAPMEGPFYLRVIAQKSIPASWSKKKQLQAIGGTIRPTSKPDVDNYAKAIMDGLSGIVWKDDSQVVSLMAEKIYSVRPGVHVEIEGICLE